MYENEISLIYIKYLSYRYHLLFFQKLLIFCAYNTKFISKYVTQTFSSWYGYNSQFSPKYFSQNSRHYVGHPYSWAMRCFEFCDEYFGENSSYLKRTGGCLHINVSILISCHLAIVGIPIMKIRWSLDSLIILKSRNPFAWNDSLYLEMGLRTDTHQENGALLPNALSWLSSIMGNFYPDIRVCHIPTWITWQCELSKASMFLWITQDLTGHFEWHCLLMRSI